MASYTPGAAVADDRKAFSLYDTVSAAFADFDFDAAGYSPDDPLDDPTKGEVKLYASLDPNFEIFTDLTVGGVVTEANGLYMFMDTTPVTGAYFVYNLPNIKNITVFFKAILLKDDEVSRCTIYWQHDTNA